MKISLSKIKGASKIYLLEEKGYDLALYIIPEIYKILNNKGIELEIISVSNANDINVNISKITESDKVMTGVFLTTKLRLILYESLKILNMEILLNIIQNCHH